MGNNLPCGNDLLNFIVSEKLNMNNSKLELLTSVGSGKQQNNMQAPLNKFSTFLKSLKNHLETL
jgi:hypothetical protein